jgi:hypothetical protein
MTMMHMMRKHPSTSRPLLMILPTVLVTPIAPSPITMMVSKLIRSMRWVFLKLSIRQQHEIVMTTMASAIIIAYQIIYSECGGLALDW